MTTIAAPAAVSPALLPPGRTLRLEGALLFMAAVTAYAHSGTSWWLFAGLLLVPDIGMLGYAAGARVGAFTYNLTHTLALPLGLGLVGLWTGSSTAIAVALVWAAHIGMDRALGYGLKYPTHFRDTHLQRVR
jgi:hypothetical protein